ncbi:ComF family protein [Thiothrix nivea]|uniref:Phosphoribosyltransferase n=1 Tax=Thiothrix nivea (strain ATCC 35100 / DSM 5205 / JP2) TaxID=870187 RepID=A0A656HF27_THINJ|nr:ComF family protein [Thiothrix nivea]EIJ35681.1 phosphoribosyltransferase [Thiothrix nivea DSM 5205]
MKVAAHLLQAANLLLHPGCAFCGLPRLPGYPLCEACHADLPWLPVEYNPTIAGCTASLSAFAYHPPINNLLLGIKFGKNLRELAVMGELTAVGILSQLPTVPDAILPVPLHTARLHIRGFNQALELARPLAKQLAIPLLTDTITRHKATQAQTELDSNQRQHNLHQAFRVQKPIRHQHIAIFDDVITTGSTARELASLLLAHGVQQVDIWSCARSILRQKHEAGAQIDYH